MELQQIISLSFVQGLTEFIPVSSSAHLLLLPVLFGWPDQGIMIDVAVHVGTLGAVMLYFWRDVLNLAHGGLHLLRLNFTPQAQLFLKLSLATIPAVVVGYTLSHLKVGLRGVEMVAITMTFFAVFMYIADRFGAQTRGMAHVTFGKAFLIGLFQSLALIPGVSRSGSCIVAARILGFKRADAAKFSFLLSIPAIIAAATYTGYEAVSAGQDIITKEVLMCMGLSFVFGFLAIAFMMYWLRRSSLTLFVMYRILLGMILLILLRQGIIH